MNINDLETIALSNKIKDLTGKKQGKLTYIKPAENKNGHIYWWVQCECGNIEKIRNDNKKLQCNICSKKIKSEHLKGKKAKDLSYQRFGKLIALYPTDERKHGNIVWHCKCDCGNEVNIKSGNLVSGITQSCGCLRREKAKEIGKNTIKDLTGQRFGYLIAIKPTDNKQDTSIIWECLCDCGKTHYVSSSDLVKGSVKSCGCQKYNKEKTIINMIGKKFGKLKVIEKAGKDSDGSYNYLCQCDCGNKKIVNGVSLRQGVTTSCGCIQYSIGEKNIKDILDANNINYIKEYSVKELNYKRFDFALIKDNVPIRFIEFDGRQHYEPYPENWEKQDGLTIRQKRDQEKNNYAFSHNIPLVRIPYWERDNITLEMILGEQYLVKY